MNEQLKSKKLILSPFDVDDILSSICDDLCKYRDNCHEQCENYKAIAIICGKDTK